MLQLYKKKDKNPIDYRDDQWCDATGEAGERPADVKHPHVLGCDDHGETKDERHRADHQAELPPDLLHHPAPQQAPYGCSHIHYGLKNKTFNTTKYRLAGNDAGEWRHTPNQEAWLASSCSRGSPMAVSSGMTGELYPSTNPKLMGPRTEAKVARYKFLFFTLLQQETGSEWVVKGRVTTGQVIIKYTLTQPTLPGQHQLDSIVQSCHLFWGQEHVSFSSVNSFEGWPDLVLVCCAELQLAYQNWCIRKFQIIQLGLLD